MRWVRDASSGSLFVWDANEAPHLNIIWGLGIDRKDYDANRNWGYIDTKQDIDEALQKSLQPVSSFKKADLWPAQEASEVTLTQSPGAIAYNNPKDTSVSGPNPNDVVDEDKLWSIVVNEFFTAKKRWSDVVKGIRSIYPNVTDSVILSLKDRVRKSLDNQMGMIGSKKVAYHAVNDLTQFALDDKQIQQHFINRGTTVEDVIASLPNFTIKYITKELEQQDPSLKDTTKGLYDYNSGTLYVNPRISLDAKRITIIHEIEHAIQDSIGGFSGPAWRRFRPCSWPT